MKCDYSDITSRLGSPLWWDEAGVPRYEAFAPESVVFASAKQAALIEIACQGCGTLFQVALSSRDEELSRKAQEGLLEYGDPPVTACCALGMTMNSVPLRLLEFWQRGADRRWQKGEELEGPLQCSWVKRRADGQIVFEEMSDVED